MRWAIISSLMVHSVIFGFVLKNSAEKTRTYPPTMIVRLASPPPSRGVEKPAAVETSRKTPSKKPDKIEPAKTDTRLAEVNKQKKPKRKKEEPKPQPQVSEEPPAEKSDNRGLPDGVDLGSEFGSARLDAVGFDSPYFLNVLFSKIRRGWDSPYGGGDSISCTIYFVVDRGGKISDSAIETTSGLAAFDQAALRAVLGSKPPPLPNQFTSDELGIHLEFKFIPFN